MELRNYMLNSSVDLVDCVIDEVALEGLDGITLEALWQRMALRLQEDLPLTESLMGQIWSTCSKVKGFMFYELKKAREPLIIFDRFELLNEDEKKAKIPKDIYPHFPIDDLRNGIRGSCSSYNTRVDITLDARYYALEDIITNYGQKFIIVASQSLRERALVGDTACPVMGMNVLQYCFLERVGRARYHGDVSSGKTGIGSISDDPKSLFYHRKFLLKQKLITKQAYSERVSGNSYSGSLLHLTRFYVERRPKFILLSETIINYLKSKPNYISSYEELKEKLELKVPLKKIFKTPILKTIIKTDIKVPYGNLNPQSTELTKNGLTLAEKIVRAVQLVDPNIDINQFWGKHDGPDEEESYDLDTSRQKLNVSYLKQANKFVEDARHQGLSQSELGAKLGMTKLHTRTILRNLVKTRIVATYMNDVGKQRVTKYIAKKFEYSSEMSKQLIQEMDKMKEFNRSSQEEKNNDQSPPPPPLLPPPPPVQVNLQMIPLVNPPVIEPTILPLEIPEDEIQPMDTNEDVHIADELQNYQVQRDEQLFASVNKIFAKYKNLRSRTAYRYTHLNLAQLRATTFWNENEGNFESQDTQNDNETPISNQSGAILSQHSSVFKDVKTKIVASCGGKKKNQVTGFLENFKNSNQKNVTYRLLKRANLIIEAVKDKKVIDDTSKLLKMIKEEEDKEGYFVRIDKRSLARVLQRLAKDNLVKYIKLTLSDNARQKVVTYICDPSIDKNHSLIQSAVEQAKIKFCLLRAPNVRASKSSALKKQNLTPLFNSDSLEVTNVNLFLDPKIGKKYGYSPKFLRMKALHNLLFYLVYEHNGKLQNANEDLIGKFREEGIFIDDELESKMNEIYANEVSWKMFIPPLHKHPGWSDGWALMCDVLIRLPLSIFVKVYNIPYVIPDLESYLDHPIKKHFLVKDISPFLRNILLKSRKYIFVIHETITRLCYLGLVQFGPQKLKEKDQIFLYVNRHGQLTDTTSSSVSYHRIEEKSYPVRRYEFKTLLDVEKYWYDMWEICVHTSLGGRLAVQGKDILLEDLPKKIEMIMAAKPRDPRQVQEYDTGEVPGDHQGAAGLDSALFSHLKRNWTWGHNNYTYQQYKTSQENRKTLLDTTPKSLEEAIQDSTFATAKEIRYKKVTKSSIKAKATVTSNTEKEVKETSKPSSSTSKVEPKKKSYVRRVLPRKITVKKRVKYDEVDYKALQRMDKLRVDWEPHEDNVLLMCKVAMMYLFPNPRKQFVTFIAVRDTLRTYSNCSNNKTSRACQRRLHYMLKQSQTISSVMLGIEEIKQNYFVNKRFNGLVDRIKGECHNPVEYEEKVTKIFKELVAYISKKYYDISNMEPRDPVMVPQTIQAFNLIYDLRHPSKVLNPKGFTKDVKNPNDIHVAILNSVIHSSMCSGKDRRSWAYQLFKIYQQYSEANLRAAIFKIRSDQMVSIRKGVLRTATVSKSGNYMPMTNAQYQLSLNYYYKFQTKWPYSVFSESYNLLYNLIQWQCENQSPELNFTVPENVPGIEMQPITGGVVAGIHDFFAKDQLDFAIEMPDQVIMLDPRLQEKNDVYLKIAKRYQSLLMNYNFATESGGPRVGINNQPILHEFDDRPEQVPNSEIMQRPLLKKGTIDDNFTVENPNTVFLEEPNWNQNDTAPQSTDPDRINLRGIKRCPSSDDDDEEEPYEKKLRIDETIETTHIAKRQKTNDNVNSDYEPLPIIHSQSSTKRQYYSTNLQKVQAALLNTMREPNRLLQKSIELENQKLKESMKEIIDVDPLQVDPPRDADDYEPRPARRCINDFYYTRFGMLKMRQEYTELTLADSHHAHDFFVVNSFNIFLKLKLSDVDGPRKLDVHQGNEIPSDILPLKLNTVDNLLSRIKKHAIFPKQVTSYQEFQQIVMANLRIPWAIVHAVCMFIKEKKELGTTLLDLSTTFQCIGDALSDILAILTEHCQVLRTGVTNVRYVHQQHSDSWLIRSCKILRLEQEALQSVPKGATYVLNDETKTQTNADEIIPKQEIHSPERMEHDGENYVDEHECDDELAKEDASDELLRRSSRQRNTMQKNKKILQIEQMLNANPSEEVSVAIKPWIHVDGSLNRRVLDRMMGAILSYCIKHPGVMLNKIQNRFIPALQPFHTRELVEILIELGCLNVRVLKPQRVTLFSIPTDIKFSGNPGLAQEEELVIEPEIGATLRFGTYLSNKTYISDFLT